MLSLFKCPSLLSRRREISVVSPVYATSVQKGLMEPEVVLNLFQCNLSGTASVCIRTRLKDILRRVFFSARSQGEFQKI